MKRWLTRRRLDVPEVHRIIDACDRMLEDWAESEPDSPERRRLWRNVHSAAYDLGDAAYGGTPIRHRMSYWMRPYDMRLDARVWRWQRPGPCRVIYLPGLEIVSPPDSADTA